MGGLRFSMPITFLTFTVAGLSLIGFPGMSDFFKRFNNESLSIIIIILFITY